MIACAKSFECACWCTDEELCCCCEPALCCCRYLNLDHQSLSRQNSAFAAERTDRANSAITPPSLSARHKLDENSAELLTPVRCLDVTVILPASWCIIFVCCMLDQVSETAQSKRVSSRLRTPSHQSSLVTKFARWTCGYVQSPSNACVRVSST